MRIAADEHIPAVSDAMEGGSITVPPPEDEFFLAAAATLGVGIFLMGVGFLLSSSSAAASFGLSSGPTPLFRLLFLIGTGAINVARGAPITAGGMTKPPPIAVLDTDGLAPKFNAVFTPRAAAAPDEGVDREICATAPTPPPTTGPN